MDPMTLWEYSFVRNVAALLGTINSDEDPVLDFVMDWAEKAADRVVVRVAAAKGRSRSSS